MNFETPIDRSPEERIAAVTVTSLACTGNRAPAEFTIQSILRLAAGDAGAIRQARDLEWVATLESSADFQYFARIDTGGRTLPPGSSRRVLDLLREAEKRLGAKG